jgi:hypothetical protein
MRETQRKIVSVSHLYMWSRFPLIYMNFKFDCLDLHNVFFEIYVANELTRVIIFEAIYSVRVLSDLKILGFASYLYIW